MKCRKILEKRFFVSRKSLYTSRWYSRNGVKRATHRVWTFRGLELRRLVYYYYLLNNQQLFVGIAGGFMITAVGRIVVLYFNVEHVGLGHGFVFSSAVA